jgi:hypothetical protein
MSDSGWVVVFIWLVSGTMFSGCSLVIAAKLIMKALQ